MLSFSNTKKKLNTYLILAVLGIILQNCPCYAITIIMNFDEEESASPAFDADASRLQSLFEYAEDFYEDVFEDSHTLTINYWYDDLSAGVLGSHVLVSQSSGRETEASVRIDTRDGLGGIFRDWFIDPTPEDNVEFDMEQIVWSNSLYPHINNSQQDDWYKYGPDIPDTFEVGFRGESDSFDSMDRFDMLSTVLHEVGHALGMSSSNTSTENEAKDGDYDFNNSWIFGKTLAAKTADDPDNTSDPDDNLDIAHLENPFAGMAPGNSIGFRKLPSHSDLFAMARAHSYIDLDIPRREMYGGSNWHANGNWTGNKHPGAFDEAFIRHGGTVSISSASGFVRELIIDEGTTLRVIASGKLDARGNVFVGDIADGTLEVTDAGSSAVVAEDLHVGNHFGTNGYITVSNGGLIDVAGNLLLGSDSFAMGTINVNGMGSVLRTGGDEDGFIGYAGTGTLNVSSAGRFDSGDDIHIGHTSTGVGTVTHVSGWITTGGSADGGDIFVGGAGQGAFTQNGGTLDVDDDLIIAHHAGSTGNFSISGGSVTVGDELWVAESSIGNFDQYNGQVQVDGQTVVGRLSGSQGSYYLSGGTLTIGEGLTIGRNSGSQGNMTVTGSGSSVDVQNDLHVGINEGSEGILTVSDNGYMNVGDDLLLGNSGGQADVVIEQGSSIDVADFTFVGNSSGAPSSLSLHSGGTFNGENDLLVAIQVGSVGHVNVSGNGTQINIGQENEDGNLVVGQGGTATLAISNGARVKVADALQIGQDSSSDGTVTIDNGSLVLDDIAGDAFVGNSGDGSLVVINGGAVNFNDDLEIGLNTGSNGIVTVGGTGMSATISVNDGVGLGVSGVGQLNVNENGSLTSGNFSIGQNSGATGNLYVDNVGARLSVSHLNVGGTLTMAGGTGTVAIDNTATVQVANSLTVYGGGTVNLKDGSLSAQSFDHSQGGTFNFTAGELIVDTFEGDLLQQGGTLAPTASISPIGHTEIKGDFSMTGGSIEIEIGGKGIGEFDTLQFSGASTDFADGTLDVSLVDLGGGLFVPSAGDVFEIFFFPTEPFGNWFSAANLPVLANDLQWFFDHEAEKTLLVATYYADFDRDGDVDGDDLAIWEVNYGSANSDADGSDFLTWQRQHFGSITVALPSTAVPEPTTAVLVVSILSLATLARSRTILF